MDGRYIKPFAFSAANDRRNTTFVIDSRSILDIYRTNSHFRAQLQSGAYVYAEGHICCNDSQYILQTTEGTKLTPWANAHVDQCCLRFLRFYALCETAAFRLGALNSDEAYNRHYLAFAQDEGAATQKEQLSTMLQTLESLPASFPEALVFLMARMHITIEALEEKSCLSARTISRLRTEECPEYAMDQVIALCIALQLPPWLSREMLQRAGLLLRKTKQHQAYQLVLDCMFMDSIANVQRFLSSVGCEKLRLHLYTEG